jgi:Reverse transcriptase (RNA-dependent DNA polymerase)
MNPSSFFQMIKASYGDNIHQLMTGYSNEITHQARNISRKDFLQNCKKSSITPRFITEKCTVFDSLYQQLEDNNFEEQVNSLKSDFQKKFLNLEIRICCEKIRKGSKKLETVQFELFRRIPLEVFDSFIQSQDDKFNKIVKIDSNKLEVKFEKLNTQKGVISQNEFNEDWFVNLTEKEFPREAKFLLSLGPKFALPIEKRSEIPIFDILREFEDIIRTQFDEEKRNIAKRTGIECLNLCLNEEIKLNEFDKQLINAHKKTKQFMKENPDIYIVKSDKCNKTVAITKEGYDEKLNNLLSDETTYEVLKKDPINKLIKERDDLLNDLVRLKYISQEKSESLTIKNPIPPRIYILIKLHKESFPGRPVVSTINSVGQPIAKFINDILKNISDKEKYNIKNSFDFKNYIDSITIDDDTLEFVSFDVKSMFTNIPLDLVLDIINERWYEIKEFTKLPKKWFMSLLKFSIFECNYFLGNDKFYSQKSGLAMGSSLSPILSDLVLEKLFDSQIPKLPFSNVPFLKKYVDDTITLIPKNQTQNCLDVFNSFHQSIQFTSENENNQKINFLDMTLIRQENKIITNYYNKECSSNRILSFNSKHPFNMKFNTALAYAKRVKSLSHPQFYVSNIERITEVLLKNNYPQNVIDKVIKKYKFFKPKNTNDEISDTRNNNKKFSGLTFIPGISNKVAKKLTGMNKDLQVGFKPYKKVSNIFTKTKSKLKIENKSGVIYQLNCNGNQNSGELCNKVYIGETSRKLGTRLGEHKRDDKNRLKPGNKTALIQHSNDANHTFDFDSPTILNSENNWYKRRFLESSYIQFNKPNSVNFKQDTDNLNTLYCNIINKFKFLKQKSL